MADEVVPPDDPRIAQCLTAVETIQASLQSMQEKLTALESKNPDDPKIPALEASLATMEKNLQDSRDQMAALVKRLKPKKDADVPPEQKTKPSQEPKKKTALGHDWL